MADLGNWTLIKKTEQVIRKWQLVVGDEKYIIRADRRSRDDTWDVSVFFADVNDRFTCLDVASTNYKDTRKAFDAGCGALQHYLKNILDKV